MTNKASSSNIQRIESINLVFFPLLILLFSLLLFIQLTYPLAYIDVAYVMFCQLLVVLLGLSVVTSNKYAIKLFHYIFALQLIIAPLVISAPSLLAFNLFVIASTLALRAEYGECVLCIYEGKIEDGVLDFLESILNFNFVFVVECAVYLMLLLSKVDSQN